MESNKQLLIPTGKVSLSVLDNDKLRDSLQGILHVRDALKLSIEDPLQYPSLARIRKDFDREASEDLVKFFLRDLNVNLNLTRPLTEQQIHNIAQEVVSEYYALSIADVYLIFRNAKTGKYGDFFGSLDMPKVMGWFRDYFTERCQIGMEDSLAHQYNNSNDPRSSFLAKRQFDELESKLNAKKK